MKNINRVTLLGRLTADPELKQTKDGKPVCSVSVATNYYVPGQNDEKEQRTHFHKVVVWQKLAELCTKLLKKGSPVLFEGRLSNTSYTGKDGTKYYVSEVVAQDFIALEKAPMPAVT